MFAEGVDGVDGVFVGAGCGLEYCLRSERELILGGCHRVHVKGIELCDTLRFVSGGNVHSVDGCGMYVASCRKGLV